MASKFGHLKSLDVRGDTTTELTLHQIDVGGKSPTLIVAPATDANKPFFNAQLKRSGKSIQQIRAGRITAGMIEDNREEDRELYPRYVIKGWKDMVDAKGKAVEFSVDACTDFIDSIPSWLFDDIRNYCGNPQNFVASASIDVETAGNA